MLESAMPMPMPMPMPCRVLVPEVLPAVMPDVPAVPDVLPAPLPELVLPSRLPLDLPAEGRAALAAALEGPLPAGQRPQRGELVRESVPSRWDDEEISRLRGFLRTVDDLRGRQGRVYPLEYLLALPLIAGMAGDGELDAAAEWAATAPEDLLIRLGAPRDREGKPRRPDATTLGRALAGGCDQGQYDDALCAWSAARARALRPGMRKHLRIDGKAVRGAARGGRAPMLLSGIWDDGTTAAQHPVNVRKTNEIPVFRDLLEKVPDLAGAVISADQMHTQRGHARAIEAAGPSSSSPSGRTSRACSTRPAPCPGNQQQERPGPWTAATAASTSARSRPCRPRNGSRPVPAREAGVPRRALQLRHGRGTARRGRRPRHHQPVPGAGRPR